MNTNIKQSLHLSQTLYDEVVRYCKSRYPQQSRGIFSASIDPLRPDSFHPLESNKLRHTPAMVRRFKEYGSYYQEAKGFVADPRELIEIDARLVATGEHAAGLFHVHIDFPSAPSRLDVDMFSETIPGSENIWYSILSFLNPTLPDFRVFWIRDRLIHEFAVDVAL